MASACQHQLSTLVQNEGQLAAFNPWQRCAEAEPCSTQCTHTPSFLPPWPDNQTWGGNKGISKIFLLIKTYLLYAAWPDEQLYLPFRGIFYYY